MSSVQTFGEGLRRLVEESTERGTQHAVAPILERLEQRAQRLEEAMIATKAVLTQSEAERYAGVGYDTLKKWREEGLPYNKKGRAVYYRREDLEEWLMRRAA